MTPVRVAFALLILCSPARADEGTAFFRSTTPPQLVPSLVFEDESGAQHTLADYRGKFILLNVWATWCPPCAEEMPALDALQTKFDPKKFMVLPLAENSNDGIVSAFYRAHNIRHLPIALDAASRATSALSLRGLPVTILINPAGNEIARAEGNIEWNNPKTLLFIHHKLGTID
ncbi:MAG: TlpA disulfide reductase family protein [Bdellovibrionales bacterium]|jgi:thiol-disulfide isomerase/thioredoxin